MNGMDIIETFHANDPDTQNTIDNLLNRTSELLIKKDQTFATALTWAGVSVVSLAIMGVAKVLNKHSCDKVRERAAEAQKILQEDYDKNHPPKDGMEAINRIFERGFGL